MLKIGPQHALRLAKAYISQRKRPLLYYREDFHEYKKYHYRISGQESVELDTLSFLNRVYADEYEDTRKKRENGDTKAPWPQAVTEGILRMVFKNVKTLITVDGNIERPTWIGDSSRSYLSFSNGLVDVHQLLREGRAPVIDHSPAWFSPSVLPFAYNPEATYEQWQKFIDDVVPDKEAQLLLQEWFGYSLTQDSSFHHFMLLEGAARAGKGTLVRVLQGLVGENNRSAIALERFGDNFALCNLYGKQLNVCNEATKITPTIEEILKSLTGEDENEFDRKHKSTLKFKNRAKIVITSNARPPFKSEGSLERMLVIHFEAVVPPEKRIPGLSDILLQNESSGIFNWAIQGYIRLRQNGKFTEPKAMVEQKAEIRREDNPEVVFIENLFEAAGPEEWVSKTEAYEVYKQSMAMYPGKALVKEGKPFVALLRTTFRDTFVIKKVAGAKPPQEAYHGIRIRQ